VFPPVHHVDHRRPPLLGGEVPDLLPAGRVQAPQHVGVQCPPFRPVGGSGQFRRLGEPESPPIVGGGQPVRIPGVRPQHIPPVSAHMALHLVALVEEHPERAEIGVLPSGLLVAHGGDGTGRRAEKGEVGVPLGSILELG
jgi:hypothetical protein